MRLSSSDTGRGTSSGKAYWFRDGDTFGYSDLSGNLLTLQVVLFNVTLSRSGYINYSRVPSNLVFSDVTSRFVQSIEYTGYPMLDESGDYLYLLTGDSTGLLRIDRAAGERWAVEFASLITCLANSNGQVLIGLLNGKIKLFDTTGALVHEAEMEGNRIPVVYGCALSKKGDIFAALGGLDPQQILVAQRRHGRQWGTFSVELETELRREAFIRIGNDNESLFFEQPGFLGVLTLASQRIKRLPMPGKFVTLAETSQGALLALLSQTNDRKHLRLYDRGGSLLYAEAFAGENADVRIVEDRIMLTSDGYLMRIDISVQ